MTDTRLASLIALPDEPSSVRRRELLREITDPLFAQTRAGAAAPAVTVDEAADPGDEIGASLIARSPMLTQDDLLLVARGHDQPHLRLLAGRPDLSTAVTDALVQRADDATLGVLLRNPDAPLSRRGAEAVIDRAAVNPDLHDAVIDKPGLPIDLLNELYLLVEPRLRARIRSHNADLDPVQVERALEVARRRIEGRGGALPADYAAAERQVRALHSSGGITPEALAALASEPGRTAFLIALAELTELDFHTARRLVRGRELDGLAIVCRAADVDAAVFLAFVMLIAAPAQALAQGEAYAKLYAELPRETASRTLRFWRMRRQTGDVGASDVGAGEVTTGEAA